MTDGNWQEFERKSRAAFDASVESQDAATRSRLAQSRATALAELERRRLGGPAAWVPAGAAAAAILAALLWQREEGAAPAASDAAIAFEDFDIVAGGEDLDMLGEDADFVAWAVEQSSGDVG
jgi:hypothetical protein